MDICRNSPETRVIPPDESRRIDLPGVGPCPRPVDIDRAVTGFTRLKSLRIYRFAPDVPIHGDSEEDEVVITALTGRLSLEISGPHPLSCQLAAGEAAYMTPLHSYVLTPGAPTLVAYARAEARGLIASQAIAGQGAEGEVLGWRLVHLQAGGQITLGEPGREVLAHVASGALTCGTDALRQGETLALAEGATVNLSATGPCSLLVLGA